MPPSIKDSLKSPIPSDEYGDTFIFNEEFGQTKYIFAE